MEDTWLHFLNGLEVSCFSSSEGMRYAVHEPRSGKIFLTNALIAGHLNVLQIGGVDPKSIDPEELAQVYGFVETVRSTSVSDLTTKPPFNPLFIRWQGIYLGQFDTLLARWAGRLAPWVWPISGALFIFCIWLGLFNEWAILGEATRAISLEGLATFALMSPLLKIPHELGHALVARHCNVPLRNAGIIFVGLFPLPFVDISSADIYANRSQRIRISLAGVFVDLVIAMIAFIAWYLVDGTFLKTITANIFIFSSLNSVLFNGNPLMRLDGYFAFSDWIGHRNLSSASAQIYKEARSFVATFGRQGVWPSSRPARAYLWFGVASGLYKINILLTILWLTLPRFFGLGLLLAAWGTYAMFFSPLLNKLQADPVADKQTRMVFKSIVFAVFAAVMFIPLPFKVVLPMALDAQGTYAVQIQQSGILHNLTSNGQVAEGDPLYHLGNSRLEADIALAQATLELAQLQRDTVIQSDATLNRIATAQLEAPETELALLLASRALLTGRASQNGFFEPSFDTRTGAYLVEGSRIGALYPNTETAVLIGQFPENRIARLREGDPVFALWNGANILPNSAVTTFKLVQINQLAVETGQRSYQLIATIDAPPQTLHGRSQFLKINLQSAPVYEHIYDVFLNLRRNYLNARIGQTAQ